MGGYISDVISKEHGFDCAMTLWRRKDGFGGLLSRTGRGAFLRRGGKERGSIWF